MPAAAVTAGSGSSRREPGAQGSSTTTGPSERPYSARARVRPSGRVTRCSVTSITSVMASACAAPVAPVCHHFPVNRTDRLYAIAEELRAARQPRTATWLAERFEVTTRTVKRDISALQQAGTPVWAAPGPGGGYVLDP